MLQNRNKTYHDVRGSKIKCINYQKCPLCYGCRRYSSIDPECRKCYEEIDNTREKQREKLLKIKEPKTEKPKKENSDELNKLEEALNSFEKDLEA